MEQDRSMAEEDLSALRSRIAELVEQESVLLAQAFDLGKAGGGRAGVDALFARVQALQMERSRLKQRLGQLLGVQRLHMAREVWQAGMYDYRQEVGGRSVRVRVTKGPLGLQVLLPGQTRAVGIETLEGAFEGPLATD